VSAVNRIARRAFAAVALALPVGIATPASACALLDPDCVAGGVVDAVEEGTGGVADTVDDTTGAVDETVGVVVGAVDDATGGAIGDLVGDPPSVVPDPDASPGDDPEGRDGPHGDGRDDRRGTGVTTRRESPAGIAPSGPRRSTGPSIDTIHAAASSGGSPDRPRFPASLGPALAAALPSLAALAVLFLLTVAFVAVQDRIDRRDPRLALAPTGPRVVPFR
jgi:hypothetical protein